MIPNNYSSRRNSQRPMRDRASSSSTSSSRSPDQARSSSSNSSSRRQSAADRLTSWASRGTNSSSFPGVMYGQGMWRATGVGSFSTQEEAEWALQRDRAERGLPPIRRPSVSTPSLATEEDRRGALSRMSQSNIFGNSSRRSVEISAEDRSFYQDAVPYMTSPTYIGAGMPDDAGSAGNSGSLDQLSLARRFTGRFDDEYRDQEYGSHSRDNR